MDQVRFIQSALWPNVWVAKGIDHATATQYGQAFGYLAVTAVNSLFLSWLAIVIVSKNFLRAYGRATSLTSRLHRSAASPTGGIAGAIFFYLPLRLRLIAAKDLRTFLRDPLQWSQLLILFALMALYLINIPNLHLQIASGFMEHILIPFLNLCAVSLILATFTSRFVYPLISLEGHQLWLVGLLPVRRRQILWAKFAFAMTVTLLVAGSTMCLAMLILKLDWGWGIIHLVVTVAVCFALCSLAVGIGARWPMFNKTNPARIANGMGGTVNLIAQVCLVAGLLAIMGYATWHSRNLPPSAPPGKIAVGACWLTVIISWIVGRAAMSIGAKHFEQVEV